MKEIDNEDVDKIALKKEVEVYEREMGEKKEILSVTIEKISKGESSKFLADRFTFESMGYMEMVNKLTISYRNYCKLLEDIIARYEAVEK